MRTSRAPRAGSRSPRSDAVTILLLALLGPLAEGASASPPIAVTGERIANADREPGAWLTHGRTYSEQRFSPLSQIDAKNVSRLGLAWTHDTGRDRGHQATPLVNDGVLYLTTSWSGVQAIDLRTGKTKWSYDPDVPRQWGYNACCDVVNRGVALWGGHVFVGTIDGRLIKLDAATGDVAWDVNTIDRSRPYTITGAPRVVKGKVLIGNGGAEYGVRGYISAYDAETGELAWRFYTVPGDPSKPFEHPELEMAAKTWTGEWWVVGGGGTVWDALAFDPELDLLYVGTGNGSPWPRRYRSPDGGDNLFLSSILALDPDDGRLVWHYQTTPAENWDYTAVQHIMLADLEIDGRIRKVAMQAPKNGFFYVLDRATGELLSAEKYTRVNWASHVDRATGRPVETGAAHYDREPKIVFPGPLGGHNWQPMAFHPGTGLVYIPSREEPTVYRLDPDFEYDPRLWNLGVGWTHPKVTAMSEAMPAAKGVLKAWNPVTQRAVWSVVQPAVNNGGLLATAGDLVFQGDPSGRFSAYSAIDGELRWSVETGIPIVAAPITWELDGVQRVSVLAGWGGAVPAGDPAISAAVRNKNIGRLFTFELDADQPMPEVARRHANPDPPPAPFGAPEEIQRGSALYEIHCGRCHGYGTNSSGLQSDLRYSRKAVHDNYELIVRGDRFLEMGMPSFADILTARDVQQIHAYVVSMAQARPDPNAPTPPPPTLGLGVMSRDRAAELLRAQGLELAPGSERYGHPSLAASRGDGESQGIVELIGPADRLVGITVSWSGAESELAASLEPIPDLMQPFVYWVGLSFLTALQHDGEIQIESEGIRATAQLRAGGNRRMWFLEVVAGE
jgi:quinohemoprotein ethanol dehydrogenase